MSASELLRVRPFRVVELRWETSNIFTLAIAPEAREIMPKFLAGQWVHLHLLHADGSSSARAAFSFATAPEESRERCEMGIKVYGAFTTRASQLRVGDRVGVQGPFGVFTLREGTSPLVMIAGGIGVTPFRCMIRSLVHQRDPRPITLFYSNKCVEDAAYLEELRALAHTGSSLRLVPTLTAETSPAWHGETGRVCRDMLHKYVDDLTQADFFACGSGPLMETVREMLVAEGVDVRTRYRTERFS